MTDIAKRLRAREGGGDDEEVLMREAADEIERLRSALKRIAAEADGGRLSANDDELRDWLWCIRDLARASLGEKT